MSSIGRTDKSGNQPLSKDKHSPQPEESKEGNHVGKMIRKFEQQAPSVSREKHPATSESTSLANKKVTKRKNVEPKIKPPVPPKPSNVPPARRPILKHGGFNGPHLPFVARIKPFYSEHSVRFNPEVSYIPPADHQLKLENVELELKADTGTIQKERASGLKATLIAQSDQASGDTALPMSPEKNPLQPFYSTPKSHPVYQVPKPHSVYQAPKSHPVYQVPKPHPVYQAPKSHPVYQVPKPHPVYQAPKSHPVYQVPKSSPAEADGSPHYATPKPPVPVPPPVDNDHSEIEHSDHEAPYLISEITDNPLYASIEDLREAELETTNPLYEPATETNAPDLPARTRLLPIKTSQQFERAARRLKTLIEKDLEALGKDIQTKPNTRALLKSQRRARKALENLQTRNNDLGSLLNQLKGLSPDSDKKHIHKLRKDLKNINAQLLPIVKYAYGGSNVDKWLIKIPDRLPRDW
ncbi:hypothetical protein [Endozoicomonas lisbonensis]|uniref:Uncharacterized protein n=1 Tax=Endozoicomonas lisbonensis TaxID=3120522 RepID=A0ABV2SN54_9GAMM